MTNNIVTHIWTWPLVPVVFEKKAKKHLTQRSKGRNEDDQNVWDEDLLLVVLTTKKYPRILNRSSVKSESLMIIDKFLSNQRSQGGCPGFLVPVFEFFIEESHVKYLHFPYFSSPYFFHDFLNNQKLYWNFIFKRRTDFFW